MDKNTLLDLTSRGYSSTKIADELNTSKTNVSYWLKKYGLKTNPIRNINDFEITCDFCGLTTTNHLSFESHLPSCNIANKNIDSILSDYASNKPLLKIARDYKIGQNLLKRVLKKNSVKKRTPLIHNHTDDELGWKIHEIHYSQCFDDNNIRKIVNNIVSNKDKIYDFDYDKYLSNKLKKKDPCLCKCGSEIRRGSKKCVSCSSKENGFNRRKVERPKKEGLEKEVSYFGYSSVGRRYGVSDNTIRKWIKSFEEYNFK